MPVPPARLPVSLRPTIARPAPSWRPEPETPPTRNPFKRYWQAITDDEASWGRRVAVALGVPLLLGTGALALGVLAVALYAWSLLPETPDAYALARATRSQPSVVVDVRGERITQFEPDFQEWVPLDSIPVHLVDALIATEDRAFYAHGGVDVRRTIGAIWNTIKGDRQGGSTITQQLARNLFPDEIGNAGTVERKTKEAIAARAIEADHTKREILEAYLNTVPFLYNAFGVEMAARTYFGTHAPDLTVAQSALLVAMLKGPNQFNPVRHPEAATTRRNLVLQLMADQGVLPRDESAALQADSLGVELRTQPSTYSAAPHFTAAVRAELEGWALSRGYDIDRDGLVVFTTLDMTMQREAQAAVAARGARLQRTADAEWRRGVPRAALDAALRRTVAYARARDSGESEDDALATVRTEADVLARTAESVRRVEASLVAIQPETGAVRAYVGSRDFAVDEYDHAGVALRQPGSTFKAFVFAGALQRGYGPDDEIESGAAEVELDDGTTWRPAGGSSAGTLADALAYSKNSVTARLTQEIGPHRVALVAQRMGVNSDLDVVPSIGLGTSPVTLLDMVSAYATIANDGLRRRPRLITRVETASGTVLDEFGGAGQQALTRRDARNLLDMMRGVIDRGTGRALREMGVTGDLAGKTGTTQRYADGWFIAMRPGLAVGAWVGFNDQRVTFRSKATGEGSRSALPVVADFLVRVQDRLPDVAFPPPPGRYDALDFDADGDSTLVDEPEVADFDADEYENVFGEDPYEPAPIDLPEVERPAEDRPALREPPPGPRRIGWDTPPEPRAPAEPPAPRTAPTPRRPVGDPTIRNPNNRGGKTAEEILREARDGGG
ncbi:transglycosylase domain-containing protein [Rubrivirga sp. IMCC43871]|uniref:transglycosylase domain-containing protein n=1 Tax=Rubrivirga sp. IMCC43871 TaxID=3391575 RepID=UPI003990109A